MEELLKELIEKNKIMQEIVEISNLLAENSMEDMKRYTN